MTDELKQWEQDKGYMQGKAYMLQKIEDIKAEIKGLRYGSDTYKYAIDDVLEIIDSHISGKEKE